MSVGTGQTQLINDKGSQEGKGGDAELVRIPRQEWRPTTETIRLGDSCVEDTGQVSIQVAFILDYPESSVVATGAGLPLGIIGTILPRREASRTNISRGITVFWVVSIRHLLINILVELLGVLELE
jgi:hypothetical protein